MNAVEDHSHEQRPRPAQNIDINRCLVVCESSKHLRNVLVALRLRYGAFVKFKNGFPSPKMRLERDSIYVSVLSQCPMLTIDVERWVIWLEIPRWKGFGKNTRNRKHRAVYPRELGLVRSKRHWVGFTIRHFPENLSRWHVRFKFCWENHVMYECECMRCTWCSSADVREYHLNECTLEYHNTKTQSSNTGTELTCDDANCGENAYCDEGDEGDGTLVDAIRVRLVLM